MCGITGFITKKNFFKFKESFTQMVLTLTHRGPDDTGTFYDEKSGVGLGHCRLSVIDLSEAGHQPMGSDDGTVWISYNGEIYNFLSLKKTLEKDGYHFRSSTDTEVIINAYRKWGIACLEKFIGMFSFALWDRSKDSLYLVRDRLGIKPLYYYFNHETLLFSSELKAFMAFKDFQKDLNYESLRLFLHYQYIPAPNTIFNNTFKLSPGHFAVYHDGEFQIQSYWDPPDFNFLEKELDYHTEDAVDGLDEILTRAVSDRLISDVPLGALLSGGIDSSMVVALMQKINNGRTRTFSIGFNEKQYDEAPWAAKVAEYLGTDHTELYASPIEAIGVIQRLPEIYDEPFADSSAIPTLLVSSLARSKVTVALSGDGGDEQFCGYVRYWSTEAMAKYLKLLPGFMTKYFARSLNLIPADWVEKCYLPLRTYLPEKLYVANFNDKWQKLLDLMGKDELEEIYRRTICLWSKSEVRQLTGEQVPESHYENIFHKTQTWPVLSRLMRVDLGTYLPDAMLTKVDRASMAESLEIRVPLLDHRVVEFTSRLPEHLKFRNGSGKFLLKELLSRYLPKELFERPKMGFGVPIDRWFRNDLKEMLLDYLSTDRLQKEGLFDANVINNKISEHLSGRINHHYRLWTLMMWEMWRDKWIEN